MRFFFFFFTLLIATTLSGCAVLQEMFQPNVVIGLIGFLLVGILLAWFLGRLKK